MRRLKVIGHEDPVTSEPLLVLQLHAADEPFLPRLDSFECHDVTEGFFPFIPLFLSPRTTDIRISFAQSPATIAVASIITMFPMLCPNLTFIVIRDIKRDPVIINAVSRMLLACNPDSLKAFLVDSPLTEEAREVFYRLPKLYGLWMIIEEHTMLPQVELPNLFSIDIEYKDLDWLQGFRGVALEKLQWAFFRSESEQIGDFLGTFERFALEASVQNTLSRFGFYTSRSCNPNYSSLLSFKQLKELEILLSCDEGCSSRVDDDTITSLAQAMPKLEVLQLGGTPCGVPTGVTVHGLIFLASHCLHLSKLGIHFRGDSLADAAASAATTPRPIDESIVPREECALTELEVGSIPLPKQSATRVTLVLLQIFPRILNIKSSTPEWEEIAEKIRERVAGGGVGAGHSLEDS